MGGGHSASKDRASVGHTYWIRDPGILKNDAMRGKFIKIGSAKNFVSHEPCMISSLLVRDDYENIGFFRD